MWDRVKNDRRFQFAVGVLVIVLGVRWLVSGTPMYAFYDAMQPPAEGSTRASTVGSAMVPLVFETLIGMAIAVGAYIISGAEWLFGRVSQAVSNRTATESPAIAKTAAAMDEEPVSQDALMRSLSFKLADAAAMNELDAMEQLRVQIRKPYAMAALNEAYSKGDLETAKELVAELDKMHAAPPAPKTKKGGASA